MTKLGLRERYPVLVLLPSLKIIDADRAEADRTTTVLAFLWDNRDSAEVWDAVRRMVQFYDRGDYNESVVVGGGAGPLFILAWHNAETLP